MHFWNPATFREQGLDELDCKILYALDCDCRQSNAAIGKQLRTNKNVVNYRINKLLENGFIDRFYAVVDAPRLGLQSFRIYLKFCTLDEQKRQEIISYVTGTRKVWWSGNIDGQFDFGFLVWVKDTYEFKDFWLEFLARFQDRVENALISIYTGLYTYTNAFLLPLPQETRERPFQVVGAAFGHVEISETDRKVLSHLTLHARDPIVSIAKRLGLSPVSVRHAMKKLEKLGIVLAYRAQINFSKLGYTMYKLNLRLKNRSKVKSLQEFARTCPSIVYTNEAVGFADFEVELFVQTYDQFQAVRAALLALAGDTLAAYTHFIYYKVHDVQYFP